MNVPASFSVGDQVKFSDGRIGIIKEVWSQDNAQRAKGHHGLIELADGNKVTADFATITLVKKAA